MTTFLRMAASGGVLLGAVLLVSCVLVPWLGGPSLLPADVGELCAVLWNERLRDDALDARNQSFRRVLQGKRAVTADVVAGRLSLAEAMERFRRIEAELDDGQDDLVGSPLSAGDGDDAVAANVIGWVSRWSKESPRQIAAVVRRLEAERATRRAGRLGR